MPYTLPAEYDPSLIQSELSEDAQEKKSFSFAVIAGDGIGPEVISAALKVLKRLGEKFGFSFTSKLTTGALKYYFRHGKMMAEDGLQRMLKHLTLNEPAHILNKSTRQLLGQGRVRTPDLGGIDTTQDVLNRLLECIDA